MLIDNRNLYTEDKIDKYAYMNNMFTNHKLLHEYAEFIKETDVLDISIKNGEVYLNLLSNNVRIKMVSNPLDTTSVPYTFLNMGSYEKEYINVINLVKEDDVVFDIGANTGWYTLNWLQKNKNIKVFSFEPIHHNYLYLTKNLILNGQKAENAFNFGFSNVNSKVDFYWDTERYGASSMVNLRDTDNAVPVQCEVRTLDNVFPTLGLNKLDFIKCDVEGAEKLVFEGGIETIKRYQPIIFTEMLRKWSKKFDYHPNDIIRLLRNIGYTCYALGRNTYREIDTITDDTIETNFLFSTVTPNL